MKIFTAEQIAQIDIESVQGKGMTPFSLMENAIEAFMRQWKEDEDIHVTIVAGPGNNGGDGIGIARHLVRRGHKVRLYRCGLNDTYSKSNSYQTNLAKKVYGLEFVDLSTLDPIDISFPKGIVIDALFGLGLHSPLEGWFAQMVQTINLLPHKVYSVDIPSGMLADGPSFGPVVIADKTITFEQPKLAFFAPENQAFLGQWSVVSVPAIVQAVKEKIACKNLVIEKKEVAMGLRPRLRFDHKGSYGHALLIGGSYGKIGAALLAGKAALRSGCGLVTCHIPKCGYEIMQMGFPEGMATVDPHQYMISKIPSISAYQAIGVGCGLGTDPATVSAVHELLTQNEVPMVLDADGLNILAKIKDWVSHLPKGTVLTPHIGEFDRLFGESKTQFDRWQKMQDCAVNKQITIVLKGAYSAIATTDGHLYFNETGNPGMATGGSGDVLTGILTSLLAQGYLPDAAAIVGVYLHGLAGDIASESTEQESLLASDIIDHLGKAFIDLRKTIK